MMRFAKLEEEDVIFLEKSLKQCIDQIERQNITVNKFKKIKQVLQKGLCPQAAVLLIAMIINPRHVCDFVQSSGKDFMRRRNTSSRASLGILR